jgi:hypothetical protein
MKVHSAQARLLCAREGSQQVPALVGGERYGGAGQKRGSPLPSRCSVLRLSLVRVLRSGTGGSSRNRKKTEDYYCRGGAAPRKRRPGTSVALLYEL